MPVKKYLIGELAEKASTTVRTIRYYTEEGLLPPPDIQGKYAYYSIEHLNRLELIRRMKEAFLPLREIRQLMLSLTEDEVNQRLLDQVLPVEKDATEPQKNESPLDAGSDALEYISRLMNEQAVYRPKGKTAPFQAVQSMKQSELRSTTSHAPDTPQTQTISENWQRIPLGAGVELHLRTPSDPELSARVEQLISFAIKLFRRPSQGGSR